MSFEACPGANEDCKYFDTERGCYQDEHHLYYPRKRYKSSVEKAFRQLPENREMLCRAEHDEIHATEPIPHKPSRVEMVQALANVALQEAS